MVDSLQTFFDFILLWIHFRGTNHMGGYDLVWVSHMVDSSGSKEEVYCMSGGYHSY